ncbi:RNA polymerase sigma factor, partial [Streptomyces beijiangensis]|uniref:RNA polymerase sigma factor n=1 Tax=Streptomyces beijiangensis TaxID=163361 RepID=UPI0035572FD4
MTSSRLEHPTHTTGAHRAQRRAPGPAPRIQRPPARYEAYLDGLFTYCLSVLCDHDAATAALGDVLSLSERQFSRCPSADPQRRAWLYALARWACLRKLAELKRSRPGAHTGRGAVRRTESASASASATASTTAASPAPVPQEQEQEQEQETADSRRRELALLAWPEAAGTTPEQREALELAVRHRLAPAEVASVLGMDPAAARTLLAAAACEVERTRAALAVVETGNCSSVARLTGDRRVLLSSALRRELVRHVDDCPRCRRAAERAGAAGPWPGSALTPSIQGAPAELPLVGAPRQAAYVAMLHAPRSGAPRFGRNGFPLDPKDHAARRDRLRARAVTTTVVATVVAAPVLALWAAYRGAPFTGEGHDGSRVTASEKDGENGLDSSPYDHYENAGNARTDPSPGFTAGSRAGADHLDRDVGGAAARGE